MGRLRLCRHPAYCSMTNPFSLLLIWPIAVLLVYTIAMIQIAVQNKRRFTIQHLLTLFTLIAAILWLVLTLWRLH